MSFYKRLIFTGGFDIAWRNAHRFYNAARYRDWWVSKDGTSIYLTEVPQGEVNTVLRKLNITDVLHR